MYICTYIQYFKLLLTFIKHSATIKYFKTLELIHFQIKIPKGGQAKAKEGQMLFPAPTERNPASVNGYGFNIPIKNPQICITVKLLH